MPFPQSTITWALGLVITGVPAIYGGASWVDGRYALSERLVLVEQRLEEKIQADNASVLQQRAWKLEDRYSGAGVPTAPESVKEEYRQVREAREQIVNKLDRIEKKGEAKADHK